MTSQPMVAIINSQSLEMRTKTVEHRRGDVEKVLSKAKFSSTLSAHLS